MSVSVDLCAAPSQCPITTKKIFRSSQGFWCGSKFKSISLNVAVTVDRVVNFGSDIAMNYKHKLCKFNSYLRNAEMKLHHIPVSDVF